MAHLQNFVCSLPVICHQKKADQSKYRHVVCIVDGARMRQSDTATSVPDVNVNLALTMIRSWLDSLSNVANVILWTSHFSDVSLSVTKDRVTHPLFLALMCFRCTIPRGSCLVPSNRRSSRVLFHSSEISSNAKNLREAVGRCET